MYTLSYKIVKQKPNKKIFCVSGFKFYYLPIFTTYLLLFTGILLSFILYHIQSMS